MSTPLTRLLIVATMLFALIGQAFAYSAMSCDMSSHNDNTSAMTHAEMNHSQMMGDGNMSHAMMNSSDVEHGDCCDVDCNCPANACSSLTTLSISYNSYKIDAGIEKIHYVDFDLPNAFNKSLFRPPIFA